MPTDKQIEAVRAVIYELAGMRFGDRTIRAAIEAAEAAAWRPFSEAPEDGTEILVYRPDAGVFLAHYVEVDAHLSSVMNPPEEDACWFATSGDDLTGDLPTLFRPLPQPPGEEATR